MKWEKWKSNLYFLKEINVFCCYFGCLDIEGVKIQLYYFCDVFKVGYGIVFCLCIEYLDGFIECVFVIGKFCNVFIKIVSIF